MQEIVKTEKTDYGPAMSALTEEQRRFVNAYADTGGASPEQAASMAGIEPSMCRVRAYDFMRSSRVLAAVREVADQRVRNGALMAASVLIEIASDRFHKDRMKAAVEILNRAGLIVETRHHVVVEDHRTEEEIRASIKLLAQRLGVDPKKLIGNVVDAEFVEVDAEFEKIMEASKP